MKLHLLVNIGLLLIFALTVTGCYVHMGAQPATASMSEASTRYVLAEEIRDVVYSEPDWPQSLRADFYLPQKHGPLPVVLVIHGGGWAGRSRDDMTSISLDLAHRGYAVMNLDYRFAPQYTFPAQLDDLQQALSWLSKNAELYQLDLERVNAWGYSSGAHLAALLGGLEQRGSFADPAQQLPQLRAVVAGGIPADLRKYSNSPIVERFMGGTRDDMPERYAEASPQYHVSADDPPVFLYHGKLDSLVEQDQPRDYYDALIAAGVDAELFLQGFRGHMTMFLFGGTAEARAMDFLDRKNTENPALAGD